MGDFFRKVKRFILAKPDTVRINRSYVQEEQIPDINQATIKALGFAKAQLATAKSELKKVRSEAEKLREVRKHEKSAEQVELKELMHKGRAIEREQYEGGLSLKWLFRRIDAFKEQRNRGDAKAGVALSSYNGAKIFGYLDDLWLLKDGTFGVVMEDPLKKKRHAISGTQLSDVFTTYDALPTYVKRGLLPINQTERGEPHLNLRAERVPRLIRTTIGKIAPTDIDTEEVQKQIDALYTDNSEKAEKIARLEKALNAQSKEVQESRLAYDIQKDKAENSEKVLIEATKAGSEERKVIYDLVKENQMVDFSRETEEQINRSLENVKEKLLGKIRDTQGETDMEMAEENFRKHVNWIQDLFTPLQEQFANALKTAISEAKAEVPEKAEVRRTLEYQRRQPVA